MRMLVGLEKECRNVWHRGDILAQKPVTHTCREKQCSSHPDTAGSHPASHGVWRGDVVTLTSQAATALDFDFNDTNLCSSLEQTSLLCVLLLSHAFPPQ